MKPPLEQLALRHSVYDPVKAHEYYIKTRKLKGRTVGLGVDVATRKTSKGVVASRTTKKAVAPHKSAAQRRKEAEAKVVALKGRLEKLQKVLAELTKQAKARSGVKSSETKKSNTKEHPKKKLTAKQKAEAAKRSKKYYEEHKTPSQQAKELEDKIKTLEKRIRDLRAKLKKK